MNGPAPSPTIVGLGAGSYPGSRDELGEAGLGPAASLVGR
jgi:hypothetical protein